MGVGAESDRDGEEPGAKEPREVGECLAGLPSVSSLAAEAAIDPHHLAVAAAREEISELRDRILAGEPVGIDPERMRAAVAERARRLRGGSLRRVINATGIVLHTNLGRAPLARRAADAAAELSSGYANLEYGLGTGRRDTRHAHVEPLLKQLSGAEAAFAVNNNAAAVVLAAGALARGREVVVSRGQLIEIGDSFRIPEILEQSGARLVEVGTTNRTRPADYEAAIGAATGALMRVHQSNFRLVGFTEQVPISAICALGRERGIPVIDDLGSGALEPLWDEPPLRASVSAGATLVCCSADKLLGGPQAGIIAGEAAAVERCRSHPLARALRIDKLQLAALEATLRLHRDEGPGAIPALAMLRSSEEELATRAHRMVAGIGPAAHVDRSAARAGGGSLPTIELEGPVCVVRPARLGPDAVMQRMRLSDPPVVARISEGAVVLDPRTMSDSEADAAARSVKSALI